MQEKSLFVKQVALVALHRRVAYHSGCSADKGIRFVAAGLEVLQYHYADKVPDVQRITRRIDPYISGHHPFAQLFFGSRGDVVNHTPPSQFLYEILFHMLVIFANVLLFV